MEASRVRPRGHISARERPPQGAARLSGRKRKAGLCGGFLLYGSLAISSLPAICSTWQTAHSASLSVAFASYAGSLRLDETWKYKFRLLFCVT